MNDLLTEIKLTDHEILLLDGQDVSDSTRAAIEAAKLRQSLVSPEISEHDAALIQQVVDAARKNGKLTYMHESIRYCSTCKKQAGYAKAKHSTRWVNKGEPDTKKPLYMSAVDFAAGFIRFKGVVSAGACKDCVERLKPHILAALKDIRCELPEALTGVPSAIKKIPVRHCTACNWEGPETAMGRAPALMGGSYPAKCPQCKAENLAFGKSIIERKGDEFVLLEA